MLCITYLFTKDVVPSTYSSLDILILGKNVNPGVNLSNDFEPHTINSEETNSAFN